MKITKEIVQKTAHLARLDFDEENMNQMVSSLQKMVDWMDKLREVDTKDVAPLTEMSFEKNQFRKDVSGNQLSREQALSQAPKHTEEYFIVPKVINS